MDEGGSRGEKTAQGLFPRSGILFIYSNTSIFYAVHAQDFKS